MKRRKERKMEKKDFESLLEKIETLEKSNKSLKSKIAKMKDLESDLQEFSQKTRENNEDIVRLKDAVQGIVQSIEEWNTRRLKTGRTTD